MTEEIEIISYYIAVDIHFISEEKKIAALNKILVESGLDLLTNIEFYTQVNLKPKGTFDTKISFSGIGNYKEISRRIKEVLDSCKKEGLCANYWVTW